MYKLSQRTTGKQLVSIIDRAIKERKKTRDMYVANKSSFCRMCGISRTQLYRYTLGGQPTLETLIKVNDGLKKWGFEVQFSL